MFPIDIPADTTVESLFTEVYPALHRKLVSASSGGGRATSDALTSVIRLEGGGPSYTIVVRGNEIDVTEGEAKGAPLWVTLRRDVVERFLEDWMGPKKYVPKTPPPDGMVLLSDPRVMRRLAMVSARVELALTDFEGERVSLTAGCGDVAKKGIDPEDPDVVIEATMDTLTRLVGGQLSPEAALVDGHVTQTGKRFVAMQLALALAPFFPAKR